MFELRFIKLNLQIENIYFKIIKIASKCVIPLVLIVLSVQNQHYVSKFKKFFKLKMVVPIFEYPT